MIATSLSELAFFFQNIQIQSFGNLKDFQNRTSLRARRNIIRSNCCCSSAFAIRPLICIDHRSAFYPRPWQRMRVRPQCLHKVEVRWIAQTTPYGKIQIKQDHRIYALTLSILRKLDRPSCSACRTVVSKTRIVRDYTIAKPTTR